jgi:NADH:ubiquinone oxidoreductase subunit F (NADH-binding)
MMQRLLAGPPLGAGPEPLPSHAARLGGLPGPGTRIGLVKSIEAAGLVGRGGAGFPAARKWAAVAANGGGDAVVLVNGAEGEPLSAKDRVLMTTRPHLVLEGAELAAEAVGASRIVLYIGEAHATAARAIEAALAQRGAARARLDPSVAVELVVAPATYVAGEESAAVHFVNDGDARPTSVPPRPFERGVDGRSTLVQNVETLAHAALIARYGDAWYREAGRSATPGTALVTVGGTPQAGVTEIELGTTLGDLAAAAGAPVSATGAPVLVGGYFGGWMAGADAWSAPLDPFALRRAGRGFGCGVVHVLAPGACGVETTARILDWMAGQSAAQCGPCVFGLRAIADAAARVATRRARGDDLRRLRGWTETLAGRGACRHPDGAVNLLRSAFEVFGSDFDAHHRRQTCLTGQAVRAA